MHKCKVMGLGGSPGLLLMNKRALPAARCLGAGWRSGRARCAASGRRRPLAALLSAGL